MKLQLKRSNVIESGAAKIPTSAQLEYGELAINYNQEDPAIFLKDSNNNVIRISGIGNIADDGQVELPASTTPPANPLSGNLWFNSDDGRLYIYYTDADSSQWIDASPDSWDPSSYPDLTDPTKQPNTLDGRYVMDDGDNMTGDLTLGTDKITLDATNGSISTEGELIVTGNTRLKNFVYGNLPNSKLYIADTIGLSGNKEIEFSDVNVKIARESTSVSQLNFDILNATQASVRNGRFVVGDDKISLATGGDATFNGTVTANGTVLTRAAGDLDVGDRLEKADAALQTLKTAAAASTDFASLKAAIATALANI